MSTKRFKDMDEKQQSLYIQLSEVIEKWADKYDLNKPEGIRSIFEVLVTLTLALKALYLIKAVKKEKPSNEIPASDRPRDTEVPTGTDQPSGNTD